MSDHSFAITSGGEIRVNQASELRYRLGDCTYCGEKEVPLIVCHCDLRPPQDIFCVGCLATTAETAVETQE